MYVPVNWLISDLVITFSANNYLTQYWFYVIFDRWRYSVKFSENSNMFYQSKL